MTTSRGRTSDADATDEPWADSHGDETPDLNAYEVHADRTVLVESSNTDGWIATDTAVTPPE